MILKNKIAIVTGASGYGYGHQIAESMLENGAKLIITSRSKLKLNKKINFFKKKYDQDVSGYILDLSKENSIKNFVKKIYKESNRIDILINNASDNKINSVEKYSINDWNYILQTNITGTMLLTREVAKRMLLRKKGSIINISSIYGVVAPHHKIYGKSKLNSPLAYGVSKAAIIHMTKYLSTYYAPNLRVNCISPGGLYAKQDKKFVSNYKKLTPLNRMANKSDLKGTASFLASDLSGYITGQNIIVDGGWTTH